MNLNQIVVLFDVYINHSCFSRFSHGRRHIYIITLSHGLMHASFYDSSKKMNENKCASERSSPFQIRPIKVEHSTLYTITNKYGTLRRNIGAAAGTFSCRTNNKSPRPSTYVHGRVGIGMPDSFEYRKLIQFTKILSDSSFYLYRYLMIYNKTI